MSWVYLIVAGVLEVVWALGLKSTNGWTRLWPSLFTVIVMIASFYFLSLALKEIPLGTGYAIWTGIGAVGTAILGIILLGESVSLMRIVCIGVIIAGIVGLKTFSSSQLD